MAKRDPLEEAIASVDAAAADAPIPVELVQQNLILSSSNRPAIVAHPADMTDAEIMDLCAYLMLQLAPVLRARRATKIEIVRLMPGRRDS
jgi:hypothetical protein